MFLKNKGIFAVLLIMLLLCSITCVMADETRTLAVENTPVKGKILLDKTGKLLSEDGRMKSGYLKDALFEIRAAEDITGREGTLWYKKGDLVDTITTSGTGLEESSLLPLGKYEVTEIKAPSGYVLDRAVYTVELRAFDHEIPVITATVTSINDPVQIMLIKKKQDGSPLTGATFALFDLDGNQVSASISDDEGYVRFNLVPHGEHILREVEAPEGYLLNRTEIPVSVDDNWTNTERPIATVIDQEKKITFIKTNTAGMPMPGINFCLINTDTKKIVESSVSDENGVFSFTQFDYGTWKVCEMDTPDGYCPMEEYMFTVDDNWKNEGPILLVNIPNHYEFKKTDSSGAPMKGVQFVMEDADGKVLMELTSDAEGMVEIRNLVPGTYFIRETKTLEGFTLSNDVRKLVIDETYMIPEKLPAWVNYTTIQTGANIAVTWVMWIGIGLMLISGTSGVVRKKRKA